MWFMNNELYLLSSEPKKWEEMYAKSVNSFRILTNVKLHIFIRKTSAISDWNVCKVRIQKFRTIFGTVY